MSILPKAICRLYAIFIKLPMVFFTELEQIISQPMWIHERPQIAKATLRKKNGTKTINLPGIRLHYNAIVIKTAGCCHKNRNTDQWNWINSPAKKPCTYGHLIYYKGGKTTQWRKDSLFSKWCWENWTATGKQQN